jgi:hypothetical protein
MWKQLGNDNTQTKNMKSNYYSSLLGFGVQGWTKFKEFGVFVGQ